MWRIFNAERKQLGLTCLNLQFDTIRISVATVNRSFSDVTEAP
jgi:hypothetical protein